MVVAFLKKSSAIDETAAAAVPAAVSRRQQHARNAHGRRAAQRRDQRPLTAPAAPQTRRAAGASSCVAAAASRRHGRSAAMRACATRILSTLARRAYRRPVVGRRRQAAARAVSRRARTRAASTPASSAPQAAARQPRVPVPRRARSAEPAAEHARTASAIWSWRRDCRSSCGAASRTTSCSTSAAKGQLKDPARAGAAGAADDRRPARRGVRARISPGSGCSCATCRSPARRRASFPISTTPCGRRSAARPSCSSTASCARTATRSICCAPTTRSSTSGWRGTTASTRSRAATSGAYTWEQDSVRGGLLGQGSILTVTSHPDRTSPVVRGKWILENLLGTPPPPPPPNVGDLKPTDGGGGVLSMRERLAQHRANPVCASCHAMMDPLGLSLENFDGVGQWRTRSESSRADRRVGGAARRHEVRRPRRPRSGAARALRPVR